MRQGVCWLADAPQPARRLRESGLEGIKKGNSGKPAERIVPVHTSALAPKANRSRRAAENAIAPPAATSASTGASQNAGWRENEASQCPCNATCLSNGFDGPFGAGAESTAKPGRPPA